MVRAPVPILAAARPAIDAAAGDNGEFRHGLTERGLPYVVQVATTITAYPHTAQRTTPPYTGRGQPPKRRYHQPATSVKDLALAAGRRHARTVTWRDGSRTRDGKPVKLRSQFVFLRVRPAGRVLLRAHRGQDLPEAWLIAQWPAGASEVISAR